ncbi:hypothetical protein VCSRO90_2973 [Vibrio cholerae]|nr:hypothetical protein VCSRO136_2444 [Vibrio cholerae]GIB17388.1 hypothetical protein VCSRO90_2973 [Vibrio cholerae]
MIELTFALIVIIVTGISMISSHLKSAPIELKRDGQLIVNKSTEIWALK